MPHTLPPKEPTDHETFVISGTTFTFSKYGDPIIDDLMEFVHKELSEESALYNAKKIVTALGLLHKERLRDRTILSFIIGFTVAMLLFTIYITL